MSKRCIFYVNSHHKYYHHHRSCCVCQREKAINTIDENTETKTWKNKRKNPTGECHVRKLLLISPIARHKWCRSKCGFLFNFPPQLYARHSLTGLARFIVIVTRTKRSSFFILFFVGFPSWASFKFGLRASEKVKKNKVQIIITIIIHGSWKTTLFLCWLVVTVISHWDKFGWQGKISERFVDAPVD